MQNLLWNSMVKYVSRLAFFGLILFELLNQFGVLSFQLDFTWFGLILTSMVVWIVIELAGYFLRTRYNCTEIIAPLLAIAMLMVYIDALGDIYHFYSRFAWYDRIAHYTGGMICALGFGLILLHLERTEIIRLGKIIRSVFIISFTALGAALYETEEYLEDFFTGSHRLGDGPDTADDLMLGIIGAIVITILIEFGPRMWKTLRNKRNKPEKVTITIQT